jgi:hypothetical protein
MSEQGFPPTFSCTFNRWQIRLQFQTNPNQDELTVKSDILRDGRPATEREHELWRPWHVFIVACIVKNLAEANGYEKLAADVTKWSKDYEKAVFGNFRSPEKRKAVNLLLTWRREMLLAATSGQTISDSDQFKLLLGSAISSFGELDHKVLANLTQAARFLNRRYKLSSVENLDRWLQEYKLRVSPGKEQFPEEIHRLVPGFSLITLKKLHEKLHDLEVPHKHKPRGKASPNYGFKKGWGEFKARLTSD